ncbi:hypothetical protein LP421_00400 (plasmid) [Rhizobium sp. RCAM05350]|nr:hypothetical protein LP421_00400 [Rhizobium sp. RCAM05350]
MTVTEHSTDLGPNLDDTVSLEDLQSLTNHVRPAWNSSPRSRSVGKASPITRPRSRTSSRICSTRRSTAETFAGSCAASAAIAASNNASVLIGQFLLPEDFYLLDQYSQAVNMILINAAFCHEYARKKLLLAKLFSMWSNKDQHDLRQVG